MTSYIVTVFQQMKQADTHRQYGGRRKMFGFLGRKGFWNRIFQHCHAVGVSLSVCLSSI